MSFEDGRDLVMVGVRVSGRGSELFEELVPAARREDDDEFGRLIGEVQKRVRETGG